MLFERQAIDDVILIKPNVYSDERGYFAETFRQDLLEQELGKPVGFVQDNESKSNKGVLRGLHYQLPPNTQTKLVRVIEGSVLDVAVDVRKNSATFGRHVAVELSAENKYQLFIPKGFAHGFVVLSKSAIFSYKVDDYYAPEHEYGIAFDDPDLNIDWQLPLQDLILSNKDQKNLPLSKIQPL